MCFCIKTVVYIDAQSHRCIGAAKQNTRKGKPEHCTMHHQFDLCQRSQNDFFIGKPSAAS